MVPGLGRRHRPTPAALDITNALKALTYIPSPLKEKFNFMAAGDGDVGYFLEEGEIVLEIGFNEGTISYYGHLGTRQEIKGDHAFAAALPGDLAAFIAKIAGPENSSPLLRPDPENML